MMPRDTNPYGTIFGGVVLSHIDMAGAIGAAHAVRARGWAERPLVTVAMASVEFHKPVFVGDVVSYWTKVKHWGRTSVTMKVTVEADRGGKDEKLTEAEVTYVAVDLSSEPRQTVPIGDD
jgi:acyl-CoA thioesterase YciA